MEQGTFQLFLGAMSIIALFVFIALYFVKAGYGMFRTASWGISINNKLAWMLMEAPVFIVMLLLWWNSARYNSIVPLIFFLLFQLHYFQRAFVFPFLLKANAQRTYDLNLTRCREGDITGMDMNQFQTQLSNKKIAYTQALINYKIELLNLKILSLYDFEHDVPIVPMEDLVTKK